MSIRLEAPTDLDRLFLEISAGAINCQKFFKSQSMDLDTFTRLFKNSCVAEKVENENLKICSTTHGLRGTLTTILFQHGYSYSSVALRTSHRDQISLKIY